MLVSVTRLHLRSILFLPRFLSRNEQAVRQILRSPGFVRGKLLVAGPLTYWTMTLWRDEASMRAYRGSGAHGGVMPELPRWCDEGSVVHWTQAGGELPTWKQAHERMAASGRMSRVDKPSPRQQSGVIAPPRVLVERPLASEAQP